MLRSIFIFLAAFAADPVSLPSVSPEHRSRCVVLRVEFRPIQISDISVILARRQVCWDELGLVDVFHDFFDVQHLLFRLSWPAACEISGLLLVPFLLPLLLVCVVGNFHHRAVIVFLDFFWCSWI